MQRGFGGVLSPSILKANIYELSRLGFFSMFSFSVFSIFVFVFIAWRLISLDKSVRKPTLFW
jgi:hypothetical protein